jgi:hypothetical protein
MARSLVDAWIVIIDDMLNLVGTAEQAWETREINLLSRETLRMQMRPRLANLKKPKCRLAGSVAPLRERIAPRASSFFGRGRS